MNANATIIYGAVYADYIDYVSQNSSSSYDWQERVIDVEGLKIEPYVVALPGARENCWVW